ncbi:hypothetical protein GCM10027261_19480 [Geodermatophilus arenarius]
MTGPGTPVGAVPAPDVRLHRLTGLRAVAAFAVFAFHARQVFFEDGPADWLARYVMASGFTGVAFFFVLSGFVLTWSHRPGDSAPAFYRRRFARVAPAYWAACIVGAAVAATEQDDRRIAAVVESLPSLAAVQAWIPDRAVFFGGNAVGWTISCEAFFYLLFPVLVVLLPRTPTRRLLAALVLLVLTATPALVWLAATGEVPEYLGIVPVQRLTEFLLGMVAAAALRTGWRPPVRFGTAALLAALSYLAVAVIPYAYLVVAGPYALLVAAAAARDLEGGRPGVGGRWGRRLGEWSFAFYLVHQIALRAVAPQILFVREAPELALLATIGCFLLALVGSIALYRIVEAPLERRLRGTRPRPEMVDAEGRRDADPDDVAPPARA